MNNDYCNCIVNIDYSVAIIDASVVVVYASTVVASVVVVYMYKEVYVFKCTIIFLNK